MSRPIRARVPLGLAGMIAVVAVAEWASGRVDLGASNPDGVFWRYRALASRREAPRCRVLCLGDSLVKYAVAPDAVGARLRRRACNLALLGGPPAASYFQLRRALGAGSRPDALVVDFIPHLLDWDLRYCAQLMPEVAGPRDWIDLARSTSDPGFVAMTALARILPTVRDRHGLRARVAARFRRREGPVDWDNWGPDAAGGRNPKRRPGAGFYDSILYPDSWVCSPANAEYVERFLGLAEARGVAVFWVIPPFTPGAHARRELRGLDSAYTRYVRGVQARHGGLVVVDGRRSGYDEAAHSDPIHLNRLGAGVFSSDLADVIGRHLAAVSSGDDAPRWVDLPAFRRPAAIVSREPAGRD